MDKGRGALQVQDNFTTNLHITLFEYTKNA
ncbi:hypothetical protein CLV59_102528 [Chitinophaga dinghuensis]|uniref:Uncharacterized protein n=1 Tax=Chitinophaga dinghuensis TaxID=1539050 RepID=A0A327W8V5_9BACT|nr:hypothetical protein CLV59_102528 [Chitinophaga dinghuensis]